jgi:phosphoglycerate dehydrogenase-like enzyme
VSRTLLILDGLFDDIGIETDIASRHGWTIAHWDGGDTALGDADAVLHVRTRIDGAMLDRLPACRVVGRYGTGLDSVDLEAAAVRGIAVVNVRDYCIPEMTAHTLALALGLDRRIGELARTSGLDWTAVASTLPLRGRTSATVIGFGSVGRSVARTLAAMGHAVSAVTRNAAAEAEASGIEPLSLDEGLRRADIVLLHCALDATTAGLIGRAQIETLPPHAILVNTARLGLIDEAAVANAIETGRLAGAGIDARLDPGSPLDGLRDDPRLIVTPHVGWYSERSAAELRRRAVENTIAAADASAADTN